MESLDLNDHVTPPPPSPTPSAQELQCPPAYLLVKVLFDGVWYKTKWIPGDGNCMFEAFSRAYGEMDASYARHRAVLWMRDHWEEIEAFQAPGDGEPASKDKYLETMASDGVWGDQLALTALCAVFKVSVRVLKLTDEGSYCWLETGYGDNGTVRTLTLHLANSHYENLFSAEELNSRMIQ